MNNTLIDNTERFNMVDVLREHIDDPACTDVRIATGYWDLPGTRLIYESLSRFLNRGGHLQLLIGEEPVLRSYQLRPHDKNEPTFPDFYIQRDINQLSDEYLPVASLLLDYCDFEDEEHSQVRIRVYGQKDQTNKQFLHAKCYIFLGDGFAKGIIGSSNLTEKGLSADGNAELNYYESQNSVVSADFNRYSNSKSHRVWFEEKWEQSEPWTGKFIEILKASPLGKQLGAEAFVPRHLFTDDPLTPYELYIKLLQIKFGHLVDLDLGRQIQNYLPQQYDTYQYQIDAVKQCYTTMKEHGGFLLADVVGLGKTIVGTLLIRHFLQMPDEEGREQKVLIITPPAIQSAWKRTIQEFDEDSSFKIAPFIDFITTGSIGKLTDIEDTDEDEGSGSFGEPLARRIYGLIMIDESHKFRNSGTAMYVALDELIEYIAGETGLCPYVGLLSATPQNNRPSDLQNQIYLFERSHAESTLKRALGGNLEGFFSDINSRYATVLNDKGEMSSEEREAEIKLLSRELRDCVLSDIMVRRTRTDVNKYYKNDIDMQGLIFPEIVGPVSLEYKMSKSLACLFYDTMSNIVPDSSGNSGLMYYRYRAIQYLADPKMKQKYDARGSRNADALADQLARIMQLNLVKRLESSFTAFKQSLLNLRQYTQNMIDMWEHDAIFICPDFDLNAELDRKKKEERRGHKVTLEDCFADIRKRIAKLDAEGKNEEKRHCEYHRTDFDPTYIDLLYQDLQTISELCDRWGKNSEDPKFDVFKENLRFTLFDPETNRPQKLVIFTEAIDTAESIAKAAESKDFRVLLVSAANRTDLEPVIRENFDANYKGEWKNDYDIIVTTDVLAEGINLHRANCILNYDTPWNSTRLMQRIGRVNRIGSTESKVYVYNFMPSAEGDAEIKLVQKAHTKLQSFHTLFGEDAQVFSQDEEVTHYDLNTQVNGKESPLEKYIYELKRYKERYPERYEQIERASEDLELASATGDGSAYFLVGVPNVSSMLVRVNPSESEAHIISLIEGLESFRVAPSTPAVALPDSWSDMRSNAENVVLAELANSRMKRSEHNTIRTAKKVIVELKKTQAMSATSKRLLNEADRLIRMCNFDLAKRVIRIGEAVQQDNLLFAYTQEEFDQMLESSISNIIGKAKQRYGEPQIVLGTFKA